MKISIVILTYNGWDYVHQLLMDIQAHCQGVHEVVIVDNGSEDYSVMSGIFLWRSLHVLPIEFNSFASNRGFSYGANAGVEMATGDVVILLSNDTRINSDNFLKEIETRFTSDPNILLGQSLYEHDTGWNIFGSQLIPYVEGYCVIATKEFWSNCKFDEIYSPSDYEDVDLSMQARVAGYTLQQLPAGIISHLGGRTLGYTQERLERTKRNRSIFAKKWSLKE